MKKLLFSVFWATLAPLLATAEPVKFYNGLLVLDVPHVKAQTVKEGVVSGTAPDGSVVRVQLFPEDGTFAQPEWRADLKGWSACELLKNQDAASPSTKNQLELLEEGEAGSAGYCVWKSTATDAKAGVLSTRYTLFSSLQDGECRIVTSVSSERAAPAKEFPTVTVQPTPAALAAFHKKRLVLSNLKAVAAAVELYSRHHSGEYPQKLTQLVPGYLPAPALDPATNKPYQYNSSRQPDHYVLQCPTSNGYPRFDSLSGLQLVP